MTRRTLPARETANARRKRWWRAEESLRLAAPAEFAAWKGAWLAADPNEVRSGVLAERLRAAAPAEWTRFLAAREALIVAESRLREALEADLVAAESALRAVAPAEFEAHSAAEAELDAAEKIAESELDEHLGPLVVEVATKEAKAARDALRAAAPKECAWFLAARAEATE